MCTRDLIRSPPIKRIKRGIEQLKFYQITDDETPAEVSFTIVKDERKCYYGIFRPDATYTIAYNFEGGCSQSVKRIRNFDIDDLFTYVEKLDLSTASDIKFNPSTRLYTWLDLLIMGRRNN
ncbi:Hypothetical protein HVR_LOCUS254 [uncultured virus]|nr:Hypothetical protein HVR_LOCUS254 [uncultured virus]